MTEYLRLLIDLLSSLLKSWLLIIITKTNAFSAVEMPLFVTILNLDRKTKGSHRKQRQAQAQLQAQVCITGVCNYTAGTGTGKGTGTGTARGTETGTGTDRLDRLQECCLILPPKTSQHRL